jgi:zinc protease
MRVVLVEDPRATELQVTMRYRVGSIDDPPGQEGMAHLVEHLMFQQVLGTQSIFARLEDRSTFFNATTTFEATTYVTRATPSQLEELLSIEAVRVGFRCVSITDSVFVREREVVRNELRQRGDASELLETIYGGLLPAGHAYRRSVGGSTDVIAAITREQACAFADKHYVPGNAVLVVSGNIVAKRLEVAMTKFLGRVQERPPPPVVPVAPVPATGRRVDLPAPVDDPVVLISWPLADDPVQRARMRALSATVTGEIDANIQGATIPLELGDMRAGMVMVLAVPAEGESVDEVIAGARRALDGLPDSLAPASRRPVDDMVFHSIQQGGIYRLFVTLESGSVRDSTLAAHVLAGRDPSGMLGAEITSLRTMTASDAAGIVRDRFRFGSATIVVLSPGPRKESGTGISLQEPVHDLGQHRDPPDAEEARKPSTDTVQSSWGEGVIRRELPNGLHVVLVPVTSVPTVEARLVFGAGTADEPPTVRGAALVAAHALSWKFRFINDLLAFAEAGGSQDVVVGIDDTAFVVRGLDMHLDYLLAALRRWVRDGRVDRNASKVIRDLRADARARDADAVDEVNDAWRAALFGASHPYALAGLYRHLSPTLSVADGERFRTTQFTPDNATLVIAGRFDAELANKWIDHLFADWKGVAQPRNVVARQGAATSIAFDDDSEQLLLRVALPSALRDRPRQLVAAAMLAEVAGDVRQQLGASYGLQAQLDETRMAMTYVLGGWIDISRANDVVALLRTRLADLRTDSEATARAFVRARRRVLANLSTITGSAGGLAARVQRDIMLGRVPLDDLTTANVVKQLTLDRMQPVLAELDLASAAILMRGPASTVNAAFAVLDRTPERVAPSAVAAVTDDEDPSDSSSDSDLEVENAMTLDAPTRRLTFGASAAYGSGGVFDGEDVSGRSLTAHVGFHATRANSVGLQLSLGKLSGTYDKPYDRTNGPIEMSRKTLDIFVQITILDRITGGATGGVCIDDITLTAQMPMTFWSVGVGGYLAVDLVKIGGHRLTLYGRADTEFISTPGLTFMSVGLGYRN